MSTEHWYQRQISRLLETTAREYGYAGQTGDAFADWQSTMRAQLAERLGFPEIRADDSSSLEPTQLERVQMDGYERQLWHIQTEADFFVPFYLLLPTDGSPPFSTVLTVHGHSTAGKELTVGAINDRRAEIADERRDIARQAVKRGYAAVAPDMRAFGALTGPARDTDAGRACTGLQKTTQLFGRTLAGDRCWDLLRLVDWIDDQSVLDSDAIAITGHSGGAAVAMFGAALDDRLSPVVLNAYFCTFEDSIVAIDHCPCNYVPGVLRLGEMWDIAGAIAPRPLTIVTGDEDRIFPVSGTRRAFERIQTLYQNVGAEQACVLRVGSGGHRFYPKKVWPEIALFL
ncbi:alpha/beta hydrolase family protein [Halocatena halophila]|uniref:alpha/beta hydrolase family protein n=1 Tax=Halocatena halophila TaxID=2814576 RepID=UPI002ED159CA